MAETWGRGTVEAEPEVKAHAKHTCAACGAEATWNPAKHALVCGFCGTEAPGELKSDGGEIRELDLAAALRSIPDSQRGWNAVRTSVKCQSCHAISVFDPKHQAKNCEFCGSSSLVPYEQVKDSFSPGSLLPMKIAESKARESIRAWYGTRWFAPNKLKKAALTDSVKGLYIPYWTFDAQAYANWTAEAGYYYYETEYYTDSNGRESSRQVRRTRWEYASGSLDNFFDDNLVPASLGVQSKHLRAIEPFPTQELVPYDAGYLSGWVVERYQIDLIAAAQRSRQQMDQEIQQMCSREVPGDTQRNLQVSTRYTDQTFKHILAPLWMLTYRYGTTNYQVVMNGYTGSISGEYPKSWVKITLAVLAVIIFVMIVMAAAS